MPIMFYASFILGTARKERGGRRGGKREREGERAGEKGRMPEGKGRPSF